MAFGYGRAFLRDKAISKEELKKSGWIFVGKRGDKFEYQAIFDTPEEANAFQDPLGEVDDKVINFLPKR